MLSLSPFAFDEILKTLKKHTEQWSFEEYLPGPYGFPEPGSEPFNKGEGERTILEISREEWGRIKTAFPKAQIVWYRNTIIWNNGKPDFTPMISFVGADGHMAVVVGFKEEE